jgi:hypothetical protein
VPPNAQVDLESADPATLASAVLRGLATAFADAGERLAAIVARLNPAEAATAIGDLGAFVGLWQNCYQALPQCAALLGEDLLAWQYENKPVRARLTELIEKLTEVRTALEARDLVMLADLARYELPGLAQTWQAILNSLAEQAAPASSPT